MVSIETDNQERGWIEKRKAQIHQAIIEAEERHDYIKQDALLEELRDLQNMERDRA